MKLLTDRIEQDGRLLPGNILKVDSFLNHQLDPVLLSALGKEIYDHFQHKGVNKLLTIEASGIALAMAASPYFGNVPVVFAKKAKSANIGDDLYLAEATSYTYGKKYTATVSKRYLNPQDRVLVLDDFLAEGHALRGLISLVEQSGAHLAGLAVAIEKGFQGGGDALREEGYDLLSLAIIRAFEDNGILFRND